MLLMVLSWQANAVDKKFNFFRGKKTNVKDPFKLRDPFKRMVFNRTRSKGQKRSGGMLVGNTFKNVPEIGTTPIKDIKIVGIMLGKERRAIAQIRGQKNSKHTFLLKEGMKLGVDQAEIKAILPGGIVLVEKIRNVYDQDEYLETILPIED